jgi:hypothetical protein
MIRGSVAVQLPCRLGPLHRQLAVSVTRFECEWVMTVF